MRIVIALAIFLVLAPVSQAATAQQPREGADASQRRPSLPLEPGDTLRYTVSEGTWISLDVSPDGRTLVFDLLGDLYTMPIEGGTATPITRGMAFDAAPRFSPDGRKILFVSDRSGGENLWTLDIATGDTAQITRGNDNSWVSPEWLPSRSPPPARPRRT